MIGLEKGMNAFTTYARGVDVSWYQHNIPWKAIVATGATFALLRIADGLTADSTFVRNWKEAGKYGLLRGAYHLLRPDLDGQAMRVWKLLGKYPLELGLWSDIEVHGLDGKRCERFLEAIDRKVGYPVGIYSRASFLRIFGDIPWSAGRKLWIASPHHAWPVLPPQWTEWEFWQYGQGTIDRRTVDLNLFHGTVEEMRAKYVPS